MSTRSTIKYQEKKDGHVGFHVYFDWLDLAEGCDVSKPDPVFLSVEGADFSALFGSPNSEVTLKLPRETACALGLMESAEVEALRAENRELIARREAFDEASVSGVHTCSTHCRRPNCVLRREAEALRAVLIEAVERYGKPGGPWNVPSDPGGWIYRAKNVLAGLHETPTRIDKLVARYESEDCDFSDMDWVRSAALRYVETMPDSQVRCLLYALASSADAEALRAEVEALRALLDRCRPVVESEAALMDSMSRHMAGGFDAAHVNEANTSADFHAELLGDIDAALSGTQEQPTPIADLIARYEIEDCDFSDMDWVRSAALRYVETMPDSQVRCLLYALASSADAEARISAAVAAERERWRQSIEAKAAEAERKFPLNGSLPLWLRSVEPKP